MLVLPDRLPRGAELVSYVGEAVTVGGARPVNQLRELQAGLDVGVGQFASRHPVAEFQLGHQDHRM